MATSSLGKSAPDRLQRDKVSYIRQKLADGEYDIDGRLNIILERLCEEFVVQDECSTSHRGPFDP